METDVVERDLKEQISINDSIEPPVAVIKSRFQANIFKQKLRQSPARQQRENQIARKLNDSVLTRLDEDEARLLRMRYLSRPRIKPVEMATLYGVTQETMRQQLKRALTRALAMQDKNEEIDEQQPLEKLELLSRGAARLDILANIYQKLKYQSQAEVIRELASRFRDESAKVIILPVANIPGNISLLEIGDELIRDGFVPQGLVVKNLSKRWEYFNALPESHRTLRSNGFISRVGSEQLLKYFEKNTNRIIPKDELLRNIWHRFEEPFVLRAAVSRLRRYIGEDPKNPQKIINMRGVGYIFRENPDSRSGIMV